jgi:tetratricopeptide (TPR) repeat protein
MKKFCLFILIAVITFSAEAQNSLTPSFVQTSAPQLSVNLALLNGNAKSNADIFYDEAQRFEDIGEYDDAVNMFSKAAKEYQQTKQLGLYGTTLMRLSDLQLSLSNFAEAEHIVLKKVLKNYTKLGSKSGQMAAYQQLGKIYLAANRHTESLWFYTQQGILAQQLHNKNAYIESVLGIATVKIKKKDYLLAAKDLNTAELLSKNANIVQYNKLIKSNRALIALRTSKKS